MASRTILESDISGETEAETVSFAFGGHGYEIDLTDEEKSEFEQKLSIYIDVARIVGKSASAVARSSSKSSAKSSTKAAAAVKSKSAKKPRAEKVEELDDFEEPAEETVAAAPSNADVRAWAQENSIEVPPRGRIPKAVFQQYEEALAAV